MGRSPEAYLTGSNERSVRVGEFAALMKTEGDEMFIVMD